MEKIRTLQDAIKFTDKIIVFEPINEFFGRDSYTNVFVPFGIASNIDKPHIAFGYVWPALTMCNVKQVEVMFFQRINYCHNSFTISRLTLYTHSKSSSLPMREATKEEIIKLKELNNKGSLKMGFPFSNSKDIEELLNRFL